MNLQPGSFICGGHPWRWLSALVLSTAMAGKLMAAAVVGTFTGGDPGEGLDLQGNFVYAINIGTGGAAGKVGDANFTADTGVPGYFGSFQNFVEDWRVVDLGPTDNDKNLALVLRTIRWSAAPVAPLIQLDVEVGIRYKLQLLFVENCCHRGFDVYLDGNLAVDEFSPEVVQGGLDALGIGAVITYEFTAQTSPFEIVLSNADISTPEFADHNPILNGLTLERLTSSSDSDGDELPDDWEKKYFGNLSQGPNDDPDHDGLNNAQEFALKTVPTNPDSDGDGLSDGDEVNIHHTNPNKKDTDGDHLIDGDEINLWHTDPALVDTDGDGVNDYDEVRLGTNPADKNSVPTETSLARFTGGDAGEGLDLDGTFIYALNLGGDVESVVRDADFLPLVDAEVPGATVEASDVIPNWFNPPPNYGASADDNALELVTQSIRWSNAASAIPALTLTLDNLDVGGTYKLQLIFHENGSVGRAFDISRDGELLVDDFNPSIYQGGASAKNRGSVVTHTFIARGTQTRIVLDGRTVATPEFTDHNAMINAVTLKQLAAPVDSDGDGLPDAWENKYFGNLGQGPNDDPDGDGLKNSEEFSAGTNPTKADTDGDGLNDREEITAGTNPLNPDTDGDGVKDGDEVKVYHSDPNQTDTDGDGLSDGNEVNVIHSDPTKVDTDGDGYDDLTEVFSGTNPSDPASKPNKKMVRRITGGDPADGGDFTGNFVYALNIGGADAWQVGDATFLPFSQSDAVDGATMVAANQIPAWHAPDYGDTPNDDALEGVMQSIRWDTVSPRVKLSGLIPGAAYKLQLLFAESCCTRGFDVVVNGVLVANEFAPFVVQGGINNTKAAALVAYSFLATSDTLQIVLDNSKVTTAAYTDHNPILNGLTLELVADAIDSDGDGLKDPWEIEYFGNLGQNSGGDPDGDGLTNLQEFNAGTDPTKADTDGDGLTDKEEVVAGTNPNSPDSDGDGLGDREEMTTYHTDPLNPDSDGDGLTDGDEVNIYQTDPTKADSDGDGFDDGTEIFSRTNPKNPDSKPTDVIVRRIKGGDPEDGGDFTGTFLYALNVGGTVDGSSVQVGDATFVSFGQADTVDGVTAVVANQIQAPDWFNPDFGSSAADDALELVMQSIRWDAASPRYTLGSLEVGKRYQLQLLFGEQCCKRGFDIRVNNRRIADEFAPYLVQGGIANPKIALVTYTFVADRDTLDIILDNSTVTTPEFLDHNPILNGLTLEELAGVVVPPPHVTGIQVTNNGVAITFTSVPGANYSLEYKTRLADAAWQPAGSAPGNGASTSITDTDVAHRSGGTGFWRVTGQ